MSDEVINGVRTHYVCAGRGEPVILVHGFTTSHAMWFNQIPALAKAGRRAIAYDVRGHGDSDHPGGYDLPTLVDDLAALLDHLRIGKAHMVGLSMGGIISQRFCLDRPQRCATLTVADSFPGRPDEDTLRIFEGHVEIVRERGIEGLFNHLLEHPALPVGPDFQVPLELMDAYRENFMKNDRLTLARFVDMFKALPDWTEDLAGIGCPVLLVAGELDEPCLPPMRAMHEVIPGSQLKIIPRAGHASAIEKAREFNECLLSFLGENRVTTI